MPSKKKASLSLLLLGLLALGLACQPAQGVRVARVIDGDTIEISTGERVRYIGVNAPERGAPFSREATRANQELVLGKRVGLERDVSERDRYGRLLRYVYVNGTFVNGELVRRGLAQARAYPPDTKYRALLDSLEQEARAQGMGMWSR